MTPSKIAELRRLAEGATQGERGWFGNRHSIYLATLRGGRNYVMSFGRMGMQGAQPRFNVGHVMVDAADLVEFEVGEGSARGFKQAAKDKSIYRYDVKAIDNPDARFIAACDPTTILALLDALEDKG